MANAVYPLYKASLLSSFEVNTSLDQVGPDSCAAALVSIGGSNYVYSDNDQFYTSIVGIQGTPAVLTNPVLTANVFAADGLVYTAVSGSVIEAVVIYRQNTGANSTWRLVLYEDTGIVGFPMVPNGGNLMLTWNTQGIFAL